MQFKLLNGIHRDENKNRHEAGAVVESDRPLDKIFPDKFQAMQGVAKSPVEESEIDDDDLTEPIEEEAPVEEAPILAHSKKRSGRPKKKKKPGRPKKVEQED